MVRLTAFNGGIWGMSVKAVENGYDRYSVFSKLAEYENLEEQGLLHKLPCKVGDTLYGILLDEIKEYTVYAINIGLRKNENSCVILLKNHRNAVTNYELIDFGKTVFLTKEEAEKKLAELEGGGE